MTGTKRCVVAGCEERVVAHLDIRPYCLQHFLAACYAQLDEYTHSLERSAFGDTAGGSVRRFLMECTQRVADLTQRSEQLANLERAQLLDILLQAADLSSRLRRSPRRMAAIPVRLRSEKLGCPWEEETETRVVSRYGAALECGHPVEIGDTLQVVQPSTGRQARARVVRCQTPGRPETQEIGIEFPDCDNFWGLDWHSPEPSLEHKELKSEFIR